MLPLTKWEFGVGFNYLYHRHQVSLTNAANAASDEARRAHLALAEGYASRIDASRNRPLIRAASWSR